MRAPQGEENLPVASLGADDEGGDDGIASKVSRGFSVAWEWTVVQARGIRRALEGGIPWDDPYFRRKGLVFTTWLAISFGAIFVAWSGPEPVDANELRAYVAVKNTAMSWALLVHNRSDRPWNQVSIELDGGHSFERETLGPDEKLVLGPNQFDDGTDQRSTSDPPREVVIRTNEGSVRPTLEAEWE